MSRKQFQTGKPLETRQPVHQSHIDLQKNQEEAGKRPFTRHLPPLIQRAAQSPQSITPDEAAYLQRTVGNQAVQRIVIQRKMTLGPVGDKYEQEADVVAKQVVQNINTPQPQAVQRQEEDDELQAKPFTLNQPHISFLQRQEEDEDVQMKPLFFQRQEDEEELQMKPSSTMDGGEISSDVESKIQSAKGGGRPLSTNTQSSMGQAFNADFSGVKVHTDNQSDQLNQSIQARAFTTGQDIFFRQGEYNPSSSGGQELLAHELTHTIQQTGGNLQRAPSPISPISSGLQRGSVQRVTLPTLALWKDMSKLKWKRRSGKLKKIDTALEFWHTAKNGSDQEKSAALNKLLTAIQVWQISKEEGGKESKRNVFIRTLLTEVKELLGGFQQDDETATMTLNVDVESDDPLDRTFGELRNTQVGHAWMTLAYDAPSTTRLPNVRGFTSLNKSKLLAGSPANASFGFWPEKFRDTDVKQYTNYETLDTDNLGSGTLRQPDESHDAKASIKYRVTDAAVDQVGGYIEESKGKTYQMHKFNCTSFALGAVKTAGHTPPRATQTNINQPNRLYKSLHRLKQGGESSVTDQIEVARTVARDTSKTYANLTPEEAKAITLVSYQHHKVRDELGFGAMEGVHESLTGSWGLISKEDQESIRTPDQRIPKLGLKIQQYVGGLGRKHGLQMAAVLLFEDSFKTWHQTVIRAGNFQLAGRIMNDDNKNYTNATAMELRTIMDLTRFDELGRETLGLSEESELHTSLWQLWESYMDDAHDRFRNAGTRMGELTRWIQAEWGNDDSPETRKFLLQLAALAMSDEPFKNWLRWAEVRTIRQNQRMGQRM